MANNNQENSNNTTQGFIWGTPMLPSLIQEEMKQMAEPQEEDLAGSKEPVQGNPKDSFGKDFSSGKVKPTDEEEE